MNVKERVALGSIAASAGLAAAKAAVGLVTGSLAILSEAGHSLIDLSAAGLTYFAVRLSGKPAGKGHQYGPRKGASGSAPTDTAPEGVSERVAAIARQLPGVVSVERVRARPAGAVLFVDLGVGVSRTLPLDRVSAIKERLTRAIRADKPNAEVTITTEPRTLDDETVRERVMMIAR